MNMIKWYIITIASFWLCFPEMTGAGAELTGSLDSLQGTTAQNAESTRHAEMFLAQNDKKKTSESVSADGAVKADKDDSNGESVTKEKKKQKSIKQIKPFIPSETIPADQGVDFPYDI